MRNIIKTIIVVSFLLVTASFVSAGTICKSEINGFKYYTNKPTIIQVCDKSWVEIKFDAEAHAARLARDKKLREEMRKADQLEIQRLKLQLEAKKIRALNDLKYYRSYRGANNYFGCSPFRDRPRYYRTKWLGRSGIYVYPNISSRQRHARAGHPLFWR